MNDVAASPQSARHFLSDTTVIMAVLAVCNWLIARDDPGFTLTNPSPWLLLPLFAGARYGFKSGVVSGLVVAGLIIASRISFTREQVGEILKPVFFYLAFPTVGFIAGEVRGLLARRLEETETERQKLKAKDERLEAGLEVAEESRFQLQERLALTGSSVASLDMQLRGLFEKGAPPVFAGLLRLLRDTCGVLSAAIYVPESSRLRRAALSGDATGLPEYLAPNEMEIVQLCIERNTLVTCRDTWEAMPGSRNHCIAALPLIGANGETAALLLIRHMTFLSATWRTFARMQMICRWVTRILECQKIAGENPDLTGNHMLTVPEKTFLSALHDVQAAHSRFHLPSSVAVFTMAADTPPNISAMLPAALQPILRATDISSWDTSGPQPSFRVLMPFESARDAGQLLNRVRAVLPRYPALAGNVTVELAVTEEEAATPPPAAAAPGHGVRHTDSGIHAHA